MKFYLLYIVAEWHITRTVVDESCIRRQKFKLPHRLQSRFRSLADMETKAFPVLVNRPLSGLEQAVREIHFLQWWSCEWAAGDCVMPPSWLMFFSSGPSPSTIFYIFFYLSTKWERQAHKGSGNGAAWAPLHTGWHGGPAEFLSPRPLLLDKWLDLMTDWHAAATHITKEKKILLIKTKETLKQSHLC